jgi:2-hydroxychromene-2-carboxylate isomerase
MVRDIERLAAQRGRTFVMPETFPANGLHAARIALCGEPDGWIGAFTQRVYEVQFEHRSDISDLAVLTGLLRDLDLNADAIIAQSRGADIKERLRAQSARAADLGIFGAPTCVTSDGELFWGDDRLEHALAWAKTAKP